MHEFLQFAATMHLCACTLILASSIFISNVNGRSTRFFSIDNFKSELREVLDTLKNMDMESISFKNFFLWIEEAKQKATMAKCYVINPLPGNTVWPGCDLAKKFLAAIEGLETTSRQKLVEQKAKFAETDANIRNLMDTWTKPKPAWPCPPWTLYFEDHWIICGSSSVVLHPPPSQNEFPEL